MCSTVAYTPKVAPQYRRAAPQKGTARRHAQWIKDNEIVNEAGVGVQHCPLAQTSKAKPNVLWPRSPCLRNGRISLGARRARTAFA